MGNDSYVDTVGAFIESSASKIDIINGDVNGECTNLCVKLEDASHCKLASGLSLTRAAPNAGDEIQLGAAPVQSFSSLPQSELDTMCWAS